MADRLMGKREESMVGDVGLEGRSLNKTSRGLSLLGGAYGRRALAHAQLRPDIPEPHLVMLL